MLLSRGVVVLGVVVVVALCCVLSCFGQSDAEIEATCKTQMTANLLANTATSPFLFGGGSPTFGVDYFNCLNNAKAARSQQQAAAVAAADAAERAAQQAKEDRDRATAAEHEARSSEQHAAMQQLLNWWTAIATTLVLATAAAVHLAPHPYRRTILVTSVALGTISCMSVSGKLGVRLVFVFDSGFSYMVDRVLRPMGVGIEKHGIFNVLVNAAGIAGDLTIETTIQIVTAINLAVKSLLGVPLC